jgi:hypothetical protein
MILHEHKRVKTGHVSGDLPQRVLIRMREKRTPFYAWPWQYLSEKALAVYRRDMAKKGRKVQRRRDERAIKEGLTE